MHARRALVVVAVSLLAADAAADSKDQPLPGFAGLSYRDVVAKHGCTSTQRIIRRTPKADDPELVRLLTWPRITGLKLDPADPKRHRVDMMRFEEWFSGLDAQAAK